MKSKNQILLENKIRKMVREELLTENIDQVRKIVDSTEESILQRINKLQEKINLYKSWVTEKVTVYEKNYKTIENILRKHGFEFNRITSARHTGLDNDIEKFSLDIKPTFKIEAYLRMVGRRKTFAAKGYTSSGAERQRGHHELAERMADELKSACPGMGFEINQYSLSANRGEKPSANQNVMFTMWVR